MIVLREPFTADSPFLVENLNDVRVIEHLSSRIPTPYSVTDSLHWINVLSSLDAINRIIEVNSQAVGVVGAYLSRDQAEIGYWLTPDVWGKGIASQAVSLFSSWLFRHTTVSEIINPVNAQNIASRRVMEKTGYKPVKTETFINKNNHMDSEVFYLLTKADNGRLY